MEQLKSWLPVVLLASGIVASYVTLQAKMASAEDEIEKLENNASRVLEQQILLRQQSALTNQALEHIKEDQEDIKELLERILRGQGG